MKKLITTSLVAMMLITSLSAKADIRSKDKNDPDFIKVTKTAESKVRFERCKVANESECVQLGKRDYSVSELNRARNVLYFVKTPLLAVADAVGVFVLVQILGIGTGIIAEQVFGTTEGATLGWAIWGAVGGLVGGVVTATVVDAISPFHQIRLGRSIGGDVILDVDVTVRKSILAYSNALDRVLKRIQ